MPQLVDLDELHGETRQTAIGQLGGWRRHVEQMSAEQLPELLAKLLAGNTMTLYYSLIGIACTPQIVPHAAVNCEIERICEDDHDISEIDTSSAIP
jgi:hypothetical protein